MLLTLAAGIAVFGAFAPLDARFRKICSARLVARASRKWLSRRATTVAPDVGEGPTCGTVSDVWRS
ncbi:hypothetical protein ACFWIW_07435 [Amycolatopsis sp. NPDC058340]|uniref:hypothetical protein n=1 Tax=Amycolatopsis sp. NPDC058340 TaxID=3346453 RepID=UPI00365462CE